MTKQEHMAIHKELHSNLDKLVADYIMTDTKSLGDTTVMEFIKWSSEQITNPVEVK